MHVNNITVKAPELAERLVFRVEQLFLTASLRWLLLILRRTTLEDLLRSPRFFGRERNRTINDGVIKILSGAK